MSPNALQDDLQHLYDLDTPHRVENFLITDPVLAGHLGARPAETPEQLLVHQQGEDLDLSLYLSEELVTSLDRPGDHNRHLRLMALEGVSHFLYVVWRAERHRELTPLELELQAEVDKFVTSLRELGGETDLNEVHRTHFEQVGYRDERGSDERALYEEANRLAARYCSSLLKRYHGAHSHPDMVRDLRRFYRMPVRHKLRHADTV